MAFKIVVDEDGLDFTSVDKEIKSTGVLTTNDLTEFCRHRLNEAQEDVERVALELSAKVETYRYWWKLYRLVVDQPRKKKV